MNEKKKPNIVLYTLFMIVVFVCITELFIWGKGSDIILNAINNYPQGSFVVSEAVLASLVLIVMLLFKNSYVFTQKREKITKGLFYGLFFIIGSVLFILIFGLIEKGLFAGLSVLNLLIGCFFVGVAEEFLCRGWLLNEFLERYGDTKKGIWYSIIISGLIFGLMHLGNIYTMGQSVPTTILQVISAASTGILFGLIYYKTKNIWSVVLLHGLWDFSLFISDVIPVTSTNEVISSFSIISLIFSILMVGAELLNLIPHIKDIDGEPKRKSVIIFAFVSFGFYILFTSVSGLQTSSFGKTYDFDEIEIKNIAVTRDNYEDYLINNNYYSFRLSKKDDNLLLENLNTKYSIEIECEKLYDYYIFESNNYYVIAYMDYTDSSNPFLNYVYVMKDELSNDNKFLDNLKTQFKKYLLSERSSLLTLYDRDNNASYLAAYNPDYGYYILVEDNKMSILK